MVKLPAPLLSHVSFGILFALRNGPRHGYDIMKQIAEDSGGRAKVGAGALYGALGQLREAGLIEEVPFEGAARRRYYRPTLRGWQALDTELEYFRSITALAAKRRS